MIFIDGVGIGKEDYEYNPFFKYGFKTFAELFGDIPTLKNQNLNNELKYLFPSDANLGVSGLPQSGTGQTSIFCGINAAKFIGKHFGPYPYSTLIPVLKEKNIFLPFIKKGKKVAFANAYPKVFFDYIKSGRSRLSATTTICNLVGIKLNKSKDVYSGRALTAEITNERWNSKLGYKLPIIKPQLAAKRLLRIAEQNSFTLYEYFLTDHLGHGRYDGDLQQTLKTLDDFLYTILTKIDDHNMTLIICSDHGNFEDLSVKTHTRNPSLTITAGKHSEYLMKSIKDITEIKSAVLSFNE